MDLDQLRSEIDAADATLIKAFIRRMELSGEIAVVKKESGLTVLDSGREAQKLRAFEDAGGELCEYTLRLYECLARLSREYQQEVIKGDNKDG